MKFDENPIRNKKLFEALIPLYSEREAFALAGILSGYLEKDTIRIKAIDISKSQMKELMLLAFDERILIPINSQSGPTWEDKILDFKKEGCFYVLPVVRAILNTICATGKPCCNTAIRNTLQEIQSEAGAVFIELLQSIMKHADDYQFEAGLLLLLSKKISPDMDPHDFLDLSVAGGIMSPCPRKSLLTGLSWYEINPTLYWDKAFIA